MTHRVVHIVLVTVVIVISSAAAQDSVCLKHDDGTQESKRSITGAGHAVLFDCPDDEQWYVEAIALHGSRYGTPRPPRERFSVVVASEDLKRVAKSSQPYSLFERGEEQWVKFNVLPVKVPKQFQVMVFFNPTRTKGVYVGIDEDSSPTHSATVVPDAPQDRTGNIKGDWMIQAFVTKSPKSKVRELASSDERAEQAASEEAKADANFLGNARSITLRSDTGDMDDHINIRGALYTVQFQTPKDVEAYVWQVQVFASQFGGEHDSEAVSGDVYILDNDRRIISRSTFPYSLATQQKGWISIPTLPTHVQGRFFVSLDTHGTSKKGLYMGYQSGSVGGKASADELHDDVVKPGAWSSKFADKQWMMRVKVADRPVVYRRQQ